MKKKYLLAFLLSLSVAFSAHALDIGDPAPEISPASWVTGEAADPTKKDDKTIYLVEVWSTTCPPCVRTIPMLNELQKRYADQGLKIVSFTTDEVGDVEAFLKDHPMEYSSFIDKEGETAVKYMAADNRDTIPHAFLFDKSGTLVWEGNPLDNIEGRVKQVIDGTLTREKALAVRAARDEFQKNLENEDIDGLVTTLKKLEELEPDNGQYYQIHHRVLTQLEIGDDDDIKDLFAAWYKGCQDQPEALLVLGMMAMDQGHPDVRNPALAMAAVKRAYSLTQTDKVETGIALAELYKDVGRLDLALKMLDEVAKDASPIETEMINSIKSFYDRLQEVAKNPDAPYNP